MIALYSRTFMFDKGCVKNKILLESAMTEPYAAELNRQQLVLTSYVNSIAESSATVGRSFWS